MMMAPLATLAVLLVVAAVGAGVWMFDVLRGLAGPGDHSAVTQQPGRDRTA